MATSKQIRRLATNPTDFFRFQATGKLPEGLRPQSPLITLLEQIGPRDRVRIVGLVVDQRLGYGGSRTFHNAEQALRWLKPAEEVFDSFPAESWRVKTFQGPIFIESLLEAASRVPEDLASHYPRLRKPARKATP